MRTLTAPAQVWNGANLQGKSCCFFSAGGQIPCVSSSSQAASSGVKHEYVLGQIYALAGAS
jgi:hypothetical protein